MKLENPQSMLIKHNYKPLPDYLDIKESPIHGKGLFAVHNIKFDTVLGISHIETEDFINFPNGLIRTPLSGHVNHSDDPNIRMYKSKYTPSYWKFITVKDIKSGEEITIDYSTTPCGVIDEGCLK